MMIGGSKSEGRSGRAPRSPGKFLNMILSKFTRRRQLRRQSKPQQQKWRQPMSPKPQPWPMQKNMHQTMCTTCPSCPMTQVCTMQPQTTCNDKELEDLAIQLKEAVATAELLEGAIKSILSSFDLYTEKYDRYINRYLILQRDIFTEKLFTLTASRVRLNTYGLVIHLALGNAIWRNYPSCALWNLRNFNAVNVTYSATPFVSASMGQKHHVMG